MLIFINCRTFINAFRRTCTVILRAWPPYARIPRNRQRANFPFQLLLQSLQVAYRLDGNPRKLQQPSYHPVHFCSVVQGSFGHGFLISSSAINDRTSASTTCFAVSHFSLLAKFFLDVVTKTGQNHEPSCRDLPLWALVFQRLF